MKLLYCYNCQDIKSIELDETKCNCGQVKAKYVDKNNVEWNGRGYILGINNSSF
jgi:hypothetical protein